MSKRPYGSPAPRFPTNDLVERMKSAGNDAVRLREIVQTNDGASIAAAFATLLAGPTSDDAKRRIKTRSRPCPSTPNETFVEILLFADRDTLDAMQLVTRFLLEFVRDREAEELPLRPISRVKIGKCIKPNLVDYWEEYWLPKVKVVRDSNTKKSPCTVNQLVPYLRLAYCDSVRIDLRMTRVIRYKDCEAAHDAIFGDLVAPTTAVNVLTICADDDRQHELPALRAFEAFKSVSKLVVEPDHALDWTSVDVGFFTAAAKCGVRSISFDAAAISLLPALSFGFAEPTAGGDRSISGVECAMEELNFLAELIKKARALEGRQPIDFKFTIRCLSRAVEPADFENYKTDDRTWVVDDLENGVTLKVVVEGMTTEVRLFSPV